MNIDIISNLIRDTRKAIGMSQKTLAEKSGLSIATIQGYEQKKFNPKLENLQKIASGLGVSIWDLIPPSELESLSDFEYHSLLDLQPSLNSEDQKLLDFFWVLNDVGQSKALEQVELLTKIPEYKAKVDKSEELQMKIDKDGNLTD